MTPTRLQYLVTVTVGGPPRGTVKHHHEHILRALTDNAGYTHVTVTRPKGLPPKPLTAAAIRRAIRAAINAGRRLVDPDTVHMHYYDRRPDRGELTKVRVGAVLRTMESEGLLRYTRRLHKWYAADKATPRPARDHGSL